MWKILTLTTADDTQNISFNGQGSIYAEGAFGGGTVDVHPIARSEENAAPQVSTGAAYVVDGTTKSAALPSGDYQLVLSNSTDGDVDIFYNDQVDSVRIR